MFPEIRCGHVHPKSYVLAVAAHVEDGAPRPPELDLWLYREWGAPYPGGWMDWPANEFARARTARNIYTAMNGYKQAFDKVAWCNDNPTGWELVSYVLALREGLI